MLQISKEIVNYISQKLDFICNESFLKDTLVLIEEDSKEENIIPIYFAKLAAFESSKQYLEILISKLDSNYFICGKYNDVTWILSNVVDKSTFDVIIDSKLFNTTIEQQAQFLFTFEKLLNYGYTMYTTEKNPSMITIFEEFLER